MEIVPGVHQIPNTRWSRVYLIEDERLTLVDAGLPWGVKKIVDYIRSIGRHEEEVDTVLMTHSHPDHSSGAPPIRNLTGAGILAHAHDTKSDDDKGVSLSYAGVFGSTSLPIPFLQRAPVKEVIEEGQVLPIQGGVRVIHTPGHTPGSVCFLLEDEGVLFSGDTLFSNGKGVSRSIPFPGYNRDDYQRSLKRLAELEFDVLCGGHGRALKGGASDKFRGLLASRPEPPTWRDMLKGMPKRILGGRSLSGEEH